MMEKRKQKPKNRFLLNAFTATLTGGLVTGSIWGALEVWLVVLIVYALAEVIHYYFHHHKR